MAIISVAGLMLSDPDIESSYLLGLVARILFYELLEPRSPKSHVPSDFGVPETPRSTQPAERLSGLAETLAI
jgi:hypothetical protein